MSLTSIHTFYYNKTYPALNYGLTWTNIKNLNLKVVAGQIYLKVPFHTSQLVIDQFLYKHYLKIFKALQQHKKTQKLLLPSELCSVGFFETIFGNFRIICDSNLHKSWSNKSTFYIKSAFCDYHTSQKILFKLIIFRFGSWFEQTFAQIKGDLGISSHINLVLKNWKSRWGCFYTSKNTIALNIKLVCTSENVIKYIIIHELIHYLYPQFKHSSLFWKQVAHHCPMYKKYIKILKGIGI